MVCCLVAFDVESLFTNIPLEEFIDLAVNYISEGNPDLKLTESELRSLFTVATAQTHFLFNSSFYDQIDGVAMGSLLAPVLANLFMGHHEKLWLRNFKALKFYFIVDMLRTLFVYFTRNMMPFYFSTTSTRHYQYQVYCQYQVYYGERSSSQITLFRCSS